MRLLIFMVLTCVALTSFRNEGQSAQLDTAYTVEVWADNWFEMYANGVKIVEDSVPITTERSFNAEIAGFDTNLPTQIAIIAKDFKENDTGLEYIGSRRQQIGDGGFIAQFTNNKTGKVIAVTDENAKCMVIHHAPLEVSCALKKNPIAGEGACGYISQNAPDEWKSTAFDDSSWPNATVHSVKDVGPKDGYDEINWNESAKLIWGPDLKKDNTILCRLTIHTEASNIHSTDESLAPSNVNIKNASVSSSDRCAAIAASVSEAGFEESVNVSCGDEEYAHLTSDTYPDHSLMTGIVNTNEQVPVPARDYAAPIKLDPVLTDTPKTRDSSLAVAVNGVPIFDYTGGGEMTVKELHHHQTQHDTILTQQLDECGGHAGRGDDYHYHKKPDCMIDQMKNKGDDAIIGWAFDGYPIYGDKNPDGSIIKEGALDVCNGQADDVYGYRYHTSKGAPYIIQCLMGEAMDIRELPRVAPLKAAVKSPNKVAGRPPRGGVDNLVYTEDDNGVHSMTYSYQGEDYYIRYTPSDTPNCYDFESFTVTEPQIKKGEYCR